MKLRESLQRYLLETAKVTQSRRYLWLCAIYVIVALAGALHVFEPEYWQMRRVRKHIARIRPQWEAFQRAHPGFENVEFIAKNDMSWGVVFAATGKISLDAHLMQLNEFMWGTQPPSSVDVSHVSTDFSQAIPTPATKKVTVWTTDGRRIEVRVAAEPYPGSIVPAARSPAGTAGLTTTGQALRVESPPATSADGLRR